MPVNRSKVKTFNSLDSQPLHSLGHAFHAFTIHRATNGQWSARRTFDVAFNTPEGRQPEDMVWGADYRLSDGIAPVGLHLARVSILTTSPAFSYRMNAITPVPPDLRNQLHYDMVTDPQFAADVASAFPAK